MEMYSITLRDRRITEYVVEQAYLWLYDQIMEDCYIAGDRQSEKLLLEIKQAGEVTKKTYDMFLTAFMNDQYQYLLVCGRGKKQPGLTSPDLRNYFLKFNGEIIPAGFVESFFEDDYETRAEIEAYYNSYLEHNINQFGLNCQSISMSRSETLEGIKEAHPCIFRTKFLFHFTNILKLILLIIGFCLCLGFFDGIDIFYRLDELMTRGESRILEENLPKIIANAIFLIILLVKSTHCIRCIVFYIDLLVVRLRIHKQKKAFEALDANTIADFKEYFKNVNEELPSVDYCIADDMCTSAPSRRTQYLKILNFNKEKIIKILDRMEHGSKYYKKLNFFFTEPREYAVCKKAWKKGIFSSILLIIIFFFVNIEAINIWLVTFITSVVQNGFEQTIPIMFDVEKLKNLIETQKLN